MSQNKEGEKEQVGVGVEQVGVGVGQVGVRQVGVGVGQVGVGERQQVGVEASLGSWTY